MIMTNEMVERIMPICKGIAQRSSSKFLDIATMGEEDILQNLLLHIYLQQLKTEDIIDLPLVAVMCYKHVIDMQRKTYRISNNEIPCTFNTDTEDEGEKVDPSAYVSDNSLSANPERLIIIREMFNSFEKGSKEDTYLRFWGVKEGIIDDPSFDDCKKFTEDELAKKLGYPSVSSGGYKMFREKMRKWTERYFAN